MTALPRRLVVVGTDAALEPALWTQGTFVQSSQEHDDELEAEARMRDDIRQALDIGPSATLAQRTIDITTVGRRTGQDRRIEICFYRVGDATYLTGVPGPKRRDWLINLEATPAFMFHLKNQVHADLPATARIITDLDERREILRPVVEAYNARWTPDSPWPHGDLDEWVSNSPLALVTFAES